MNITCDTAKNSRNIEERGLSFDMVADIDWSCAVIIEDIRKDMVNAASEFLAMLEIAFTLR